MNSKCYKTWLLSTVLGGLMLVGVMGCQSGPPKGTLQIFYTGNLSGNLEPCG